MERSNSSSSRSSGPFAYQTRLLERTSSTRGSGSVSRNSSGTNILATPTGGSSNQNSTRRWAPTHRVANSLDAVRGKWEERSREAAVEGQPAEGKSSRPVRDPSPSTYRSQSPPLTAPLSRADSFRQSSVPSIDDSGSQRTPAYLKRRTMPSPIIASPLSPNSTGNTVELDSPMSSFATRIRVPYQDSGTPASPSHRPASSADTTSSASGSRHRSSTFDSISSAWKERDAQNSPTRPSYSTMEPPSPSPQRPTFGSSAEQPSYLSRTGSVLARTSSLSGSNGTVRVVPARANSAGDPTIRSSDFSGPSTPNSVMSPPQYRSSYMQSKKNATYGDIGIRRNLGNHLPRIASGDAEDGADDVENRKFEAAPIRNRRHIREEKEPDKPFSPSKREPFTLNVTNTDDVAGIPGRIRLSRNKIPQAPMPLPSSRLTRGLWADQQRQFIQAYEYLCHVGEAQQWIEGCLGEELGFGVVEMEEGLRNGVVLAKLVRVFQGEAVVKRIYEAPKLDFRHSDNINIFFNFVRSVVGLPEGFIFELTDLYNKKNMPKVIYCIHALSHLLARRGMAARIGNLLGRLQFSDDQLQRTHKDLKSSGVPMPNFGNVGRELAMEINEEPEVEVETEDERRDRLLLENEASIIAFQSVARGYTARKSQIALRNRMRLVDAPVRKFQAHCTAVLVRKQLQRQRSEQRSILPWVKALQAAARASLVRRRWQRYVQRIRRTSASIVKIQAQARGILQRRRYAFLKAALRKSTFSVTKLQSIARARLTRKIHQEVGKTFLQPKVHTSVVSVQSFARGALARRNAQKRAKVIDRYVPNFVDLQAQCRGVLMRRRMRKQMAKLEDVSSIVVRIQAAARTFMARKRLLTLIRGLRKATPLIVGFQARARSNIAQQKHRNLNKALGEVKTVKAVGGLQALARASLARHRHKELNRQLEFVAPDVKGLQATARGVLVRGDYHAWRDHLHASQHIASVLQAMLRGVLQRRAFRQKMEYFRANLSKVIKIQSLFRAKETREQYRQLTLAKNVTVGTIKNFVHLLDDSEADFQEEIKVERLRKQVVENIREVQALESDLSDLDVKIALVVQNVKSFEEVVRSRPQHSAIMAATLLAEHGDPFSPHSTLDQAARRKLELYQQLFYLLQTHGAYLSRFFLRMSMDDANEKNRRFLERVVLNLFGYGQDGREDYLLLKLFQLSIREEVWSARKIEEIVLGHPMYINIALHYVRSKQTVYVREVFQHVIREMMTKDDLSLEVDPVILHRKRIELEEMRSGGHSSKPKDVSYHEAIRDPDTRALYIRQLQILQWWTEAFVTTITQSTKKMPYSMRYFARETLLALKEKFPNAPHTVYAACIGRLVYYRYLNPAIVTPETFNIVSSTIDPDMRMNLAQISKVLTQITSGVEFTEGNPIYVPINDYVRKAISQLTGWLLEVADVPDAETQFHAHEFLDATVQPKPIYISPNEIYTMHSLLSQYQEFLAPRSDDPLRVILAELGGVPHLGTSNELKEARDTAITLDLTNRFASVADPHAEEKTLWVQAKRGVLAILRVQPAQGLVESLLRPVTDEDEMVWEDILDAEVESEQMRHGAHGRQISQAAADSAYRLEDIRSLNFRAVKALAISYLLKLEDQGKITRADGFQGILNAIALDVRSKHRRRLQRQQEMESMNDALRHLAERKKELQDKIDSYHKYVDNTMDTMQKGTSKKRFVIPFSKQFYHLRELQKSGKNPKFGSFLYTAKYLYEKGILLSIDQYSPRQFDKIQLTMSSDTAGVFALVLESSLLGVTSQIASEDVRMEDLLQAKYEKRSSLALFGGKVKVNLELFLYQINKKFYV